MALSPQASFTRSTDESKMNAFAPSANIRESCVDYFNWLQFKWVLLGLMKYFLMLSAHINIGKNSFSPHFFFCAHENLFQFNLAKNRLTHSHHQPITRQLLLGDIRIIFQLRLKQHKDRIKSFWWCYHQRLSPPKLVCHCLRSPFPSLYPSVSAGAET